MSNDTDIKITTTADNKGVDSAQDAHKGLKKSLDSEAKAAKKAERQTARLNKRLERTARRSRRAARGVAIFSRGMRGLRVLIVGTTLALAGMVREAVVFNVQMARAWTMMGGGIKQFRAMRQEVMGLSRDLALAKSELAGGLYQALSAGVPKDNVISFLATAGKVAVADGSKVATAVDGITTILNAFKIEAKDTGRIVDLMFQTVAKGKTTFGELAQQISVAAPIAASLGVAVEDVLAAVATLTKQGTPTAVAMTQIRAAMLATTEVLGDGWSKTMGLAEAFQAVADKAGGSQTKLRELVGRVEAMNGVLGLTGQNAKMATQDIDAMAESAGALDNAFGKVQQFRHWHKLWQGVRSIATQVGIVLDDVMKPAVEAITENLDQWEEKTAFFDNLKDKLTEIRKEATSILTAISDPIGRGNILGGLKKMLIGAAELAAEKAASFLLGIAPLIGDLIGKAARAAFDLTGTIENRKVGLDVREQVMEENDLSKLGFHLRILMDKAFRGEVSRRVTTDAAARRKERLTAEGEAAVALNITPSGQARIASGKGEIGDELAFQAARNEEKRAARAAAKWAASKQATFTMRGRQKRDTSGQGITDTGGRPIFNTRQFRAPVGRHQVGDRNERGFEIIGKTVDDDRKHLLFQLTGQARAEYKEYLDAKAGGKGPEAIQKEKREADRAIHLATSARDSSAAAVRSLIGIIQSNQGAMDELLEAVTSREDDILDIIHRRLQNLESRQRDNRS